uniref:Uncharacterized protein n=1 Tax=Vespula pensylvanica TaxID=30213 RepID=A0A834PBR3_VESPE|nr:hypothetical protein H0235_003239 [Vespula pensylvanica]
MGVTFVFEIKGKRRNKEEEEEEGEEGEKEGGGGGGEEEEGKKHSVKYGNWRGTGQLGTTKWLNGWKGSSTSNHRVQPLEKAQRLLPPT